MMAALRFLRRAAWWFRTPRARPLPRSSPPPPSEADEPLHVACAADDNYVAHAAAMLHSVLMNSGGLPVHVHFMHDPALAAGSLRRLRRMVESSGGRFDAIAVAPEEVAGLHVMRETSRPAWYRTFLPALRPQLDRVLYLDCDLIVVDSLRPLWETRLDGHLVAAVQNVIEASLVTRHHALGIPPDQTYFNSGVLLMNLERMRRERSHERVLEHARAHGDKLIWVDQDSLNLVFGSRCLFLHPRWNTQTSMFYWPEAEAVLGKQRVAEALADPAIVHFEGPDLSKPWNYLCKHPYRERYLHHRRGAGWPDPVPERRNWRRGLLRLLPMRVVPHALLLARALRDRWQRLRLPRWPRVPTRSLMPGLKRRIKSSRFGPGFVRLYRRVVRTSGRDR
jgi:lipopolysaccharide biosynthesis glycosyltransferase